MHGTRKWLYLFLAIWGLIAISLYLIEGKPLASYICVTLLTIFYLASSIYNFIKDAPYKKNKKDNTV